MTLFGEREIGPVRVWLGHSPYDAGTVYVTTGGAKAAFDERDVRVLIEILQEAVDR